MNVNVNETESEHDAPAAHNPDAVAPPTEEALAVSADEAEAVDYDDRDIRVPRDEVDAADPPSIEDEIRMMAQDPANDQAGDPPQEPTPETTEGHEEAEVASGEGLEAEEAVLAAQEQERAASEPAQEPVVRRVPLRPATPTEAHASFSRAVRARSQSLGLTLIEQTSFLQILHRQSGHKVYMANAVRTATVNVQTTLPVVGTFGMSPPKERNGRIAAVLDAKVESADELRDVLSLIDLLASGTHGPLPSPRRKAQSAQ